MIYRKIALTFISAFGIAVAGEILDTIGLPYFLMVFGTAFYILYKK